MVVTAAPYQLQDTFWNPTRARTNTATTTGFSWWNLQCYGGASYPDWFNGLGSLVPNPQSFLVPGWSAEFSKPSDLQSQLAVLKQQSADLVGAFLWQYELASKNGHTPAEYLAAIQAGLQANSFKG